MKKIAFIWDLDGTLLDSYGAILAGVEETYEHFHLAFDRVAIQNYILRYSVHDLLQRAAQENNIDYAALSAFREASLREKNTSIQLMDGAREVLDWTQKKGIANFVYTHKGDNTFNLLRDLQLEDYFTEVLTSASGFARKPDPEAVLYLIKKYSLEKECTYYIGDRLLDVETAQQAHINSINLMIDGVYGTKISKLLDICDLKIV